MKYVLSLLTLLTASTLQAQVSLESVKSWSFSLGLDQESISENMEALKKFDLVVLDGELATANQIAQLQASSTIVLGYLSVGTYEKGRTWSSRLKKYRLDYWEQWDEYFLDIGEKRARRTLLKIAKDTVLPLGFDGLFLDNVDMVTLYPKKRRAMKRFLKSLRKKVKTKLIFAQNGDEIILRYAKFLDGWNREDLSFTYDFDSQSYQAVDSEFTESGVEAIRALKELGLFVSSTDYTLDTAQTNASVDLACSSGALPYVADIFLNQLPVTPHKCESTL